MKKFGIYNFIKAQNTNSEAETNENDPVNILLKTLSPSQDNVQQTNAQAPSDAPIPNKQNNKEQNNKETVPIQDNDYQSVKVPQKEWDYKNKSYMNLYPHAQPNTKAENKPSKPTVQDNGQIVDVNPAQEQQQYLQQKEPPIQQPHQNQNNTTSYENNSIKQKQQINQSSSQQGCAIPQNIFPTSYMPDPQQLSNELNKAHESSKMTYSKYIKTQNYKPKKDS